MKSGGSLPTFTSKRKANGWFDKQVDDSLLPPVRRTVWFNGVPKLVWVIPFLLPEPAAQPETM